jgi:hypothetical protein
MKDATNDQELPPDWEENFKRETRALNARISLGLLGKRKTESWEEFEDRAVQMFQDKGLFKGEQA